MHVHRPSLDAGKPQRSFLVGHVLEIGLKSNFMQRDTTYNYQPSLALLTHLMPARRYLEAS